MSQKAHWEQVYLTKAPDAVSWFQPHLLQSLEYIQRANANTDAKVIDVGGGESTLVDDLVASGYQHVTVLDISETAIEVAKARLDQRGSAVNWLAQNILSADLPCNHYDVWHDRAVFHFLTTSEERAEYALKVAKSVKAGGHVIVATFGPEGPHKCSGLETMRYDAEALHSEFGARFKLVDSSVELHETPFSTVQQFVYCFCKLVAE